MRILLLVGLGGAFGSMARYLISGWVQSLIPRPIFPFGTLVVNVVGCFVIGLLSYLADTRQALSPEIRTFLMLGILGGFTTYSTFGNETMNLWRDGQTALGLGNIAAQLLFGLTAVWLGRVVGHFIWR